MNHPQLKALALIIATALCFGVAYAQTNTSAENPQPTDAAVREKAFNLLESLAGQISTLQSAENRARLGANIAESLWAHDEQRARSLFALVEDDIRAGLQNLEADNPSDLHTLTVFLKLRMDTVERIAKHDATLALAFLKATELPSGSPRLYGLAEAERAFELRLAKNISANNPDLGLKLGRQSLESGFSDDLLPLLGQLNRKHREQAVVLYKEIVSKLRNVNLVQDWNGMNFALSLAHSFKPPVADELAFRDLINIFITTALANGCANKAVQDSGAYFCSNFSSIVPLMEKVDPLHAAQLKHWAEEGRESRSLRQAYDELNELSQKASVDEILALARTHPQIDLDIHWHAMMKAAANGDDERARKIAADYPDPNKRQVMLARLDEDQMWHSMNDQKLAEIQKRLEKIPRAQERAGFLLGVVSQIGPNDLKPALKLLNQASGIVDTMKPGKEQTQAQLVLAMQYCLAKSDRGFAIMESLLPKFNELVAAAAKLDGYDTRYLRDGEWNMTGEGHVGQLLTVLAQNAGYFAWCDFDRAVSLAAQFERSELRMMAQVKLAQGILAGPPKRSHMNR